MYDQGHVLEGGLLDGIFWILLTSVFLALLIRVIYASREESPADILKMRHARGEINKEEYQSIRDDILKGTKVGNK